MFDRIEVNPKVQHGKPCIKGTRIPVYVILESFAQDLTKKDVREEYPSISDEDIRECILYAALLTNEEEIAPKVLIKK